MLLKINSHLFQFRGQDSESLPKNFPFFCNYAHKYTIFVYVKAASSHFF